MTSLQLWKRLDPWRVATPLVLRNCLLRCRQPDLRWILRG
jgi:hypothetical protein